MTETKPSEAFRNWAQALAIIVGGGWAFYTFVLSEQRLGMSLIADVEAEVMDQIDSRNVSVPVVPVRFLIELENIGIKQGEIVLAHLALYGHRFGEMEGLPAPTYFSDTDSGIIDVRDVNWTAESEDFADAFFLPSEFVGGKENAVAKLDLMTSDPERYDIFAYDIT